MPHTDQRDYYVTVNRDGRVGWLAGPFATHTTAAACVDQAAREACTIDPWCDFDAFGVSSLPYNTGNPYGVLNRRLGIVPRVPS